MTSKYIKTIFASPLIICVCMYILYTQSPASDNVYKGNFNRNYEKTSYLTIAHIQKLSQRNMYISGITNEYIYLSNNINPLQLTIYNKYTKKTTLQEITLLEVDSLLEPNQFKTRIDSPYLYLTNGFMPVIMRADLKNLNARRLIPEKYVYYFEESIPISEKSLILKSYITKENQSVLAKLTTGKKPTFEVKSKSLEKQIDGIIDVSGDIHYIRNSKLLVYLYSYRNQYIIMDTSLNILHKGQTLDSFKIANIKINKNKNTFMVSGLSTPTNIRSSVHENNLYIQSNIASQNEDFIRFNESAAIDVYNLKKITYKKSFYLPKYKNTQLSDFKVYKRQLIAIFDEHLIIYQMNESE